MQSLLRDFVIIDSHADTFARVLDYDRDFLTDDPHLAVSLPKMERGGMTAQMFALYVAPGLPPGMTIKRALSMAAVGMSAAARSGGRFRFVQTAEEVEAVAAANGKCGLLSVEGGHILEGNPLLLYPLRAMGVVSMTLTHNNTNEWADSSQDQPRWGGLNDLGRTVIRKMNQLRMIVDVSHTSDDTVRDVLAVSTAPVIASHSGCKAICNHPRNLPDDLIRGIGAAGGLVQLPYYPPFLLQAASDAFEMNWHRLRGGLKAGGGEDPGYMEKFYALCMENVPPASVEDLCAHIDHAVSLVGPASVGLGSDWDGADAMVTGLESCATISVLSDALSARGYSTSDLRGIFGGNFLRVLREVVGR